MTNVRKSVDTVGDLPVDEQGWTKGLYRVCFRRGRPILGHERQQLSKVRDERRRRRHTSTESRPLPTGVRRASGMSVVNRINGDTEVSLFGGSAETGVQDEMAVHGSSGERRKHVSTVIY